MDVRLGTSSSVTPRIHVDLKSTGSEADLDETRRVFQLGYGGGMELCRSNEDAEA
jgi:hypothetical protein